MTKYLLGYILICSICFCSCEYHHSRDPRHEFTHHEVIEPKVRLRGKRHMRDLKTVREGRFESDLRSVVFRAFGRDFSIKVNKNELLFSPRYAEIYQENGRHVSEEPLKENKNHCHYSGHLKGVKQSWAALNACDGINGVVYDGEEIYHLYSHENSSDSMNLIFKASDLKQRNISCGVKDPKGKSPRSVPPEEVIEHRFRHSPDWHFPNHDNRTMFVELMVVADYTMYRKYESKRAVFQRVREIVNIMHAVYIPLNVFIVLVGVLVWNERNVISVSRSSDDTLSQFAGYRSRHLRPYAHDNAQFITDVNFVSEVVGLAFTGAMCTKGHSVAINQDYSSMSGLVAAVMAHEMGHNFNMKHDQKSCNCQEKSCIMSESTSSGVTFGWSSCSTSVLTKFLEETRGSCLTNLPKHVALPQCGNGVIELNEQCDCGIPKVCNDPCCNSTTCLFKENATCASGECCDITNCKLKKVSTTCRKNQSECDLPEFCDGKSAFCPVDVFIQDGTECKNGTAFCYQGNCQTHDEECNLLWGPESVSSPSCCYDFNTKGDDTGHCGYDDEKKTYYKCSAHDSLCGTLQCSSTSNSKLDLKVGTSVGILKRFRSCYMRGYPRKTLCSVASVDFGIRTRDPGIVASGTKCGENKVCFNQKCIGVEYLQNTKCPDNCSGNGICNSKGHCHCIAGFGPPVCDTPGVGGSTESGPPSDPDAGTEFMVTLYVMFFCIYPCTLIIISVVYLYCINDDHMDIDRERTPEPPLTQKIRSSLRKLSRPSLRSCSEDIAYDSFSSDEELDSHSMENSNKHDVTKNFPPNFPSKRLQTSVPTLPTRPSLVHLSNKNLNLDSKKKSPLLPPVRVGSKQSLCDGVILQVKAAAPRAAKVKKQTGSPQLQNTASTNLNITAEVCNDSDIGVANLKKRFEKL